MSNAQNSTDGANSRPDSSSEDKFAEIERMRNEILSSTPEIVIANHCFGLFELAAIYLSDAPPRLTSATLAIDALAGLAGAIKGRLGEHELEINDAISQLRLAYVQVSALAEQSPESETPQPESED